jgi:hypothetical protein
MFLLGFQRYNLSYNMILISHILLLCGNRRKEGRERLRHVPRERDGTARISNSSSRHGRLASPLIHHQLDRSNCARERTATGMAQRHLMASAGRRWLPPGRATRWPAGCSTTPTRCPRPAPPFAGLSSLPPGPRLALSPSTTLPCPCMLGPRRRSGLRPPLICALLNHFRFRNSLRRPCLVSPTRMID